MGSNDDKLLTTEEHLSNFVKEFAKMIANRNLDSIILLSWGMLRSI